MKLTTSFFRRINTTVPRFVVFIFLLVMGCVLYINLGRDYLFDWDEGIYAELGRQILVRRDLFTTYYNSLPWFEKPPGVAWIAGLGILLAGPSSFGARLLFPLVALYVLYTTYQIGKKLKNPTTGIIAVGLLATFNLFLGRTRAVNTDMPLLAAINTTILLLLNNHSSFSVALAILFGVWFKGIAGVLTLLISLPLLISKSRTYLARLFLFSILLAGPWHLYSWFKYHDIFLTPYFLEQVLTRATTQIEFHFEPIWYYLEYLYLNLGLGVIIITLVATITLILKIYFTREERQNGFALLWWIYFPLLIFSLAKTRLFWYILPIYPAISLTIAYFLVTLAGNQKISRKLLSFIGVCVLIQGILSAYRSVEPQKTVAITPPRIEIARSLASNTPLYVLVPESERLAEALLPKAAKLSSSFRYGGMPSLVFYYQGPVKFFYNVDSFNSAAATESVYLLVARADLPLLKFSYMILSENKEYLGLKLKGNYAQR